MVTWMWLEIYLEPQWMIEYQHIFFEIWTQICGSLGTQIVSHDHVVVSGGVLRFSWSDVLTILTTWLGFGWSGVGVGAELGWFMHFIQPSKDHDDKWFETRNPPRPIIILNHLGHPHGVNPTHQSNGSCSFCSLAGSSLACCKF